MARRSGLTLTKFFFDRAVVIRSMDAVAREAMYKSGNSIKVTAQRSMRYRKKASAPGTPPSSHKVGTGKDAKAGQLRRFLFNAFDVTTRTQVIGPQGLGRAIVPRLHEEGGVAAVKQLVPRVAGRAMSPAAKAAFRKKVAAGAIRFPKRQTVSRIVRFPARPYMAPAYDKFVPRYPKLFKGQLRKVG